MVTDIAVVIPSIRPGKFVAFMEAWQPTFEKHQATVYLIEDAPGPSVFDDVEYPFTHFTWADIDDHGFGDFIGRHTDTIRSFGFWKAYEAEHEIIVTLDDDCHPSECDTVESYVSAFDEEFPQGDYFDVGHTFGLDEYMRGFPFRYREGAPPVLQYGGWDNVPDYDGRTQMDRERHLLATSGYTFERHRLSVPTGLAVTGCIMNCAFTRDAVPMMYQLVMGGDIGYDRWGDIWSGLFAKRICDWLRIPVVVNGCASVVHTRASDSAANFEKESVGYGLNEVMWDRLKFVELTGTTIAECYAELADQAADWWFGGPTIPKGMRRWISLFQ